MRGLRLILLLVAVAGLSLLATALVLRLPGAAGPVGNADVLYLPALFDDLHRGLDALRGWHLTPGPYVFPDMAVYGLADLAAGDFRRALPLAAALQFGLYLMLGAAVHRAAGGRSVAMAVAALAMVVALLFAFGWGLAGFYALNWLVYPFVVTFHFGAVLIAAAVLLLVMRQLDRPGPWPLAGLAALILAGVLSDSFVLPYAAAPAVALSLLCALVPRTRGAALAAAVAVGGAALAAYLLQGWVNPLNGIYRAQLDLGIGYGLFRLGGVLWRADAAETAVNLGLIAFALLPVARILLVLRGLAAGEREIAPSGRIAVFAAASSLATLLAVVLFGIFRDDSFLRYFQPWLFLTALWLAHLAADRLRVPAWPVGAASAMVLAGAAALRAPPAQLAAGIEPPRTLACFQGSAAGLAGYWWAKPLVLHSGRRVQIAQVARNGAPYHWIINEGWARRDWAGGAGAPPFGFILMDGLNARAVVARYGMPDRVERCAGIPLWRYDDPDRLRRPLAAATPVTLPD
ncbi:hypothetical protein [Inquilinus sp. Marseille-Q2685]|uniref:hypothetical protein n=1 Tax=Inquilinus sp. Marseille-Q2685 TaxID=2866581 RepID=UPI001CE4B3A5|nr:hypothetical protein [Inquilinus sp. Marseille-Q2685]